MQDRIQNGPREPRVETVVKVLKTDAFDCPSLLSAHRDEIVQQKILSRARNS